MDWQSTTPSRKVSSISHRLRFTDSSLMCAIMAGPPKSVIPSLRNKRNKRVGGTLPGVSVMVFLVSRRRPCRPWRGSDVAGGPWVRPNPWRRRQTLSPFSCPGQSYHSHLDSVKGFALASSTLERHEPVARPPACDPREEWIRSRAQQVGDRHLPGRPVVFSDTTNYMSIERDHIIDLQGSLFLVRCNEREGRFGLEDQPKFWVKRASSLESGRTHILKLVFQEEFLVRVGPLQAKWVRSPDKEARPPHLRRAGRVTATSATTTSWSNGRPAVTAGSISI